VKKESLLWKQGTIFVVLLFCGLAFAPSIHANISKENELVEITTEVCGLPGQKPQTIQLPKEDAEEVDKLFEEIKLKLDSVETREEAVVIFNEAIIELDKYGLLGRLSIEQAQRLVTGPYQNPKITEFLEKVYKRGQRISKADKNVLCLFVATLGEHGHCISIGPLARVWALFYSILYNIFYTRRLVITSLINFFLFMPYIIIMEALNPISVWTTIYVGEWYDYWNYGHGLEEYGSGWIWTIGLNGRINWTSPFLGELRIGKLILDLWGTHKFYPAVQGFKGIRIRNDLTCREYFYLGSALQVSVGWYY